MCRHVGPKSDKTKFTYNREFINVGINLSEELKKFFGKRFSVS